MNRIVWSGSQILNVLAVNQFTIRFVWRQTNSLCLEHVFIRQKDICLEMCLHLLGLITGALI